MSTQSQTGIGPEVVPVHIKFENGTISVSPPTFWVSKLKDGVVKWDCAPDLPFTVEFGSDCPFYENQFSKDWPCSGLARRNLMTSDSRTYKYTVRVGDQVLDPDGGVKK